MILLLAPDPSDLTRTVVITAYSSRQVANPDYEAPVTTTYGTHNSDPIAYTESDLGDKNNDGDALDNGTYSSQYNTVSVNGVEDLSQRTLVGTTYITTHNVNLSTETETGSFSESNVGDVNNDGDTLDSGTYVEVFDVVTTNGTQTDKQRKSIDYTVTDNQAAGPVVTYGTGMEDGTFVEGQAGVGDVNQDGDELDSGTSIITFDTVLHDGVEQTLLRSNYAYAYTVTDNQTAQSFDPKDLDQDGDVDYDDAVSAGYSVVSVGGSPGGWNIEYNEAAKSTLGLSNTLVSNSTIGQYNQSFATVTAAIAQKYAEDQVTDAYIAL